MTRSRTSRAARPAPTTLQQRADNVVLGLLAFGSGSTDVLSFVGLGGIFTSAMTGNTAMLGMAAGRLRLVAVERLVAALLGFLVGVAAGALCRELSDPRRALARILGLEAVCLGLFTAIWCSQTDIGAGTVLYGLILLSAIGMGVQSVAARHINLPGLPTVVFTSTLTSIVMAVTEAALHRKRLPRDAWRQSAVFAAYLFGTLLAGAMAPHSLGLIVVLPLFAVLCAWGVQSVAHRRPS